MILRYELTIFIYFSTALTSAVIWTLNVFDSNRTIWNCLLFFLLQIKLTSLLWSDHFCLFFFLIECIDLYQILSLCKIRKTLKTLSIITICTYVITVLIYVSGVIQLNGQYILNWGQFYQRCIDNALVEYKFIGATVLCRVWLVYRITITVLCTLVIFSK